MSIRWFSNGIISITGINHLFDLEIAIISSPNLRIFSQLKQHLLEQEQAPSEQQAAAIKVAVFDE